MSSALLSELIKAFELSFHLNQSILERLQKGEALEGLDGLFAAKTRALQAIQTAAAGLEGIEGAPSLPESAKALEVQAAAARLETQLAEVLGERQRALKNVSAVTRAYGPKENDKTGQKRLNLES